MLLVGLGPHGQTILLAPDAHLHAHHVGVLKELANGREQLRGVRVWVELVSLVATPPYEESHSTRTSSSHILSRAPVRLSTLTMKQPPLGNVYSTNMP